MRETKRAEKKIVIAEAAYRLMEEKGYAGTSMLAIAKAAKASNETLYSWYGDKLGLFRALVAQNAAEVEVALEAACGARPGPMEALCDVGVALLDMLLGARAVALNRAAAADESGQLGQDLAKEGRAHIRPMVEAVIRDAVLAGHVAGDIAEITETYFALLIGDQQVRRLTGALKQPAKSANAARAFRAVAQLERLFPAKM